MASYTVVLNFNDTVGGGSSNYNLPLVQSISDPKEGIKATVIEGKRGDGIIIIPGGKKSQEIVIRGILFDKEGYVDLTTAIGSMRSGITTLPATLTLKHWTGGTWATDWAYTVRRINEIEFPESEDKRTQSQNYEIRFIVISY